jgi:hypothetical protein
MTGHIPAYPCVELNTGAETSTAAPTAIGPSTTPRPREKSCRPAVAPSLAAGANVNASAWGSVSTIAPASAMTGSPISSGESVCATTAIVRPAP